MQHIVIIIQENRTFNNLFNGFPRADTTTVGYNHLGQQVTLTPAPLVGPGDWSHSLPHCYAAYDSGKMDGFDLDTPIGTTYPPNYSYVQASDVTTYWSMASQYTLADRMFESECGPSFPSHQYLIAGQTGLDSNPTKGAPWGCDSLMTDPPCFSYKTVGDDADAAGVSWRYYTHSNLSVWSAYDAIRQIRYGADWTNGDISYPETNVLTDIQAGTLASISWVTPSCPNSDHHGCQSTTTNASQGWVASIVNAIGGSQYWNHTAIFIVWDDWGGWYDSVAPQQLYPDGLGMRVPLIVISPYARRGYVSHVNHEFGSILHFTEEAFGLAPLGTRDASSDDLSDCFDFSQGPTSFVPFAHAAFVRSADNAPADSD